MLQPGGFLLNPLLKYGITFGQFCRHIVQCSFVAPADVCALGKIAMTDGTRHCQQLPPRL